MNQDDLKAFIQSRFKQAKEEAEQALSLSEKFVEAIRIYLVQNQYLDSEKPT